MAITTNAITVGTFGFMSNSQSVDVSAIETLVAAPGVGKTIVVDQIILNSTDAISLMIGEGAWTTLLGPLAFAALMTLTWDFRSRGGMVLTSNTLLAIDGDAGQINCFVAGRII